jgi:hypothetical protein
MVFFIDCGLAWFYGYGWLFTVKVGRSDRRFYRGAWMDGCGWNVNWIDGVVIKN